MIKLDTKQIDKNLKDIAMAIQNEIRKNTRNGVDMDGVRFADYSPNYLQFKAEYQTKGIIGDAQLTRAGKVNLRLTGLMMDSISITKENKSYVIYIADPTRKIVAYAHHTGSGQKQRKFFGISKEKEQELFNKYFKKEILVKK
jgi:hypothetical protein